MLMGVEILKCLISTDIKERREKENEEERETAELQKQAADGLIEQKIKNKK